MLEPTALVGTSTHTVAPLVQAERDDRARHLALGPVWPSPTKSGHAAVTGHHVLRATCAATRRPVVARGGEQGHFPLNQPSPLGRTSPDPLRRHRRRRSRAGCDMAPPV
ncbi:MAG: thiamine phosphate synthase, partial [Deltaproteobacteria bacterium]|nr:thiamine phosphate synthase [Deltaproteobacteria bacterium]